MEVIILTEDGHFIDVVRSSADLYKWAEGFFDSSESVAVYEDYILITNKGGVRQVDYYIKQI